jgi:hypothetical protein
MNKTVLIVSILLCKTLFAQVHSENLYFDIRFGFIKGGEAVYQTTTIKENNKEVVHAVLHGYTTGFAKMVYGVDDCFESFISKDSWLPNKAIKILKEQNFRYDEEVTFDQNNEAAFSNNSGRQHIKSGICDVSSIMFHLQHSGKLDNLKINQLIEIPFWDTNEWYMLKLKFTGVEEVNTHLGKKDCIRLEPLEIAGRFFNKKNPMNIWIINDSTKLPVLMELNFTIGSVKCVLTH